MLQWKQEVENMTYRFNINEIPVEAYYPDKAVSEVYEPLLRKLTEMQEEKGSRLIVMLAAPPGAGKTTLSFFLQYLSENREGLTPLQAIGMDGFHHYRDYLNSHTVTVDGVEYPMAKIKGAPVTFDLEKLTEYIRRISAGENLLWPSYSRKTHDPLEDAITVSRSIVLLEGNYLLLNEPGWRDLKTFADYTIFIHAEEKALANRLICRKEAGGVSREAAAEHVAFCDMRNIKTCLENSMDADLMLT